MARITVEDCLKQIDNRFGLIHLAAKRVRQLRKGAEPLVACKNKDIVTALREIAAGKVHPREPADKSPRLDSRDSLLLEGIAEPFTAVASSLEEPKPEVVSSFEEPEPEIASSFEEPEPEVEQLQTEKEAAETDE